MIYLSICITLFVMIAAMHLLAKAKKETLGSLFTWISYGIIVVAALMLVCQLASGVMRMRHHEGREMHGMMMGEHHMMMREMCNEEMECCEGMEGRAHGCCGGKMKCDDGDMKDCKGMKKEHEDDHDSTFHKKHEGEWH